MHLEDWQWGALILGGLLFVGWLGNRLKAKPDPGGFPAARGIMFAAPEKRPLKPELQPYFQRLRQAYKAHPSFSTWEVKAIGREIEAAHGYNGMVDVCDAIRPVLGYGPYRELEICWDGIGEWQS